MSHLEKIENNLFLWTLIYGLLIAYGGFLPFELIESPFILREFILVLSIRTYDIADLLTNFLLYFPLGFLSYGYFSSKNWSLPLLLSFIVCALHSGGIEFSQFWIVGRVSSLVDLAANSLGSVVGALIWKHLSSFLDHLPENSLLELLKKIEKKSETCSKLQIVIVFGSYALLLVFGLLYPFVFDFEAASVRSRIVGYFEFPFRIIQLGSYPVGMMQLIVNVILFIPIGIAIEAITSHSGRPARDATRRKIVLVFLAIIFGFFLEGLQAFIPARVPDITDVALYSTGIFLGLSLASLFYRGVKIEVPWQKYML